MNCTMVVPVVEPCRLFPTDHVNINSCMSQAGLVGYDNPSLALRSLVQIMCVNIDSNPGVSHSSSYFLVMLLYVVYTVLLFL